jgi:hypothetical protein
MMDSILLMIGLLLIVASLVSRNNIAKKYWMVAAIAVCGLLIALSLNLVSESRTTPLEQSSLELRTQPSKPELFITSNHSNSNSEVALSGTAEAGSQVELYVQVGVATADSSGKWNYALKSDLFLNNQEYDLKAVATNARGDRSVFSESKSLNLPSPQTQTQEAKAGLTYESSSTQNMDYVAINGLDQVCSAMNHTGVFKDTVLTYEAKFEREEIHGEVLFNECKDRDLDAIGTFQDSDNCKGKISLIVTDRDSSNRIKEAVLYWDYSYCSRGTDTSIASVYSRLIR